MLFKCRQHWWLPDVKWKFIPEPRNTVTYTYSTWHVMTHCAVCISSGKIFQSRCCNVMTQWWGPGPSIGHSTVVFSYLCRGINRRDCQNCSVLYCVLTLCTVISSLRWAVLTVLWIGFCHNGHGMLFRCLSELSNCTLRLVIDKNSAVSRIFQWWPNMIVPVAVTADMWYVTLLFVQCTCSIFVIVSL